MTLNTIFRSALGPSTSLFSEYPNAANSLKLLSEKNTDYYHYGSHKQHKGKFKSDKKHAILSALSLLAFLFFINILQNCIREQNSNRVATMMFAPTVGATAPTGHQAKDPTQDLKSPENPMRKKAVADPFLSRKSRTLFGIDETEVVGRRRQVKFIRNFSSVNNWTRELSRMSSKDLDEQKLKTSNFPLYWKKNGFVSTELRSTPPLKERNDTVFQRFKKRERTSTSTKSTQGMTVQKMWDYKKPEKFQPSLYIPDTPKTDRYRHQSSTKKEMTTTPHNILNPPATTDSGKPVATTPRNRRSEYSTSHPGDYDNYEQNDVKMSPTPALGLDLNTFQTFPVYNYYNHRTNSYKENLTTDVATSETSIPENERMHNEMRVTTQHPLFQPTKTSLSYSKPSYFKYWNKYPVHHTHYHVRNSYPMETRYKYSPYRKTGAYEAPHFHDHHEHVHEDFYSPVVLAKYEVQHDEPGFDLLKFLWAMVTSFAKPLTKLVPSFAKDNNEEAQCYDLLVCEAQRVSRFMGPTAEALATTFGTILTWAATEETRHIVVDAINSGRENTCQQQIKDCEDRSGGKSAMTVFAQVLEMKLR